MSSFTEKVLSFQTHQVDGDEDPGEHIRVNSFYEIDHSKLPPRSPEQLLAIRVVMVNEKTRMRVSLRFPSVYSLRAYLMEARSLSLSSSKTTTSSKSSADQYCSSKMLPPLDVKYIMGSESAAEVLYRRIPPLELAAERCSWLFWAVPPRKKLQEEQSSASLSDHLKEPGILRWAHRRRVRFLAKHGDDINRDESGVSVFRSSSGDHALKGEQDDDDDEEEEEEEEDEQERIDSRKRKCHAGCGPSCRRTQTKKQQISESGDTKKQIVVYKRRNNKVLDRWSSQRYNMAEMNMLKIMKQEGAVFGNPIMRHELREKARKLIGDTGLLDHLLKHMAGKVAPGGEERFQRRHNSVGGAMEYWLEKADLDDIRKEAGVKDPYWTPPPGWKPGDDPSLDPVCAREIMQLKDQMAHIKKNMELLISSKHEKEKLLATLSIQTPPASSQEMEKDSSLIEIEEKYRDLDKRMERFEDQLLGISQSVCRIQDEMEMLKTTMVVETGKTEVEGQSTLTTRSTAPPPPKEDKAAKIERLRSGFKICKPQGTFIWPSMAISSPQVTVQLEDLLAVPTPPSVSSTSAKQSHHLICAPTTRLQHHDQTNPSPAVKPLAERKPANSQLATLTTNSNSVMNLNEPHLFFF